MCRRTTSKSQVAKSISGCSGLLLVLWETKSRQRICPHLHFDSLCEMLGIRVTRQFRRTNGPNVWSCGPRTFICPPTLCCFRLSLLQGILQEYDMKHRSLNFDVAMTTPPNMQQPRRYDAICNTPTSQTCWFPVIAHRQEGILPSLSHFKSLLFKFASIHMPF